MITVWGKRLTGILKVTSPVNFRTIRPADIPSGSLGFEVPYHAYSILLGFLKDCHSVGLGQDCTSPETYEENRYNAFSEALTCAGFYNDQSSITVDESKLTCRMIQRVVDIYSELCQGSFGRETLNALLKSLLPAITFTDNTIRGYARIADGRVFCRTRRQSVGWLPADAELGDCVCFLYGGPVLYSLRPDDDKFYRLIGECYLQGLMDGEAMDLPGIDPEDFRIR